MTPDMTMGPACPAEPIVSSPPEPLPLRTPRYAPNRTSARDPRWSAACGYAAIGWPVFVLGPGKIPVANCEECTAAPRDHNLEQCTCLACHGFYAATTDTNRIAEMLRRYRRGLLAIRTGAPSGTVVLDIDPRHGGCETLEALDGHKLLPGTLHAVTGGGGMHMVYAHPGRHVPCSVERLGPGIDVRADGGYIVVAPSRHPKTGHPYVWVGHRPLDHPLTPLPAWILDRLLPPPPPIPAPVPREYDARSGNQYLAEILTDLELTPAGAGLRNSALFRASRRAARMVSTGEVDEHAVTAVLLETAEQIGIPTREAQATIASGMRVVRRS
jgi:hypothetical protein